MSQVRPEDNPEIWMLRGKKNLVISVGDSWTWGASLGTMADAPLEIRRMVDDFDARSTQCYGRLIADELDADWINYGKIAGGNISCLQFLSNVLCGNHSRFLTPDRYDAIKDASWPDSLYDLYTAFELNQAADIEEELNTTHCLSPYTIDLAQYDNVYAFVTLTETGRDARFYSVQCNKSFDTVEQYLNFEETSNYKIVEHIRNRSNAKIFVGRNFTVDLPTTLNSQCDVPMSWIELDYRQNAVDGYNNCGLDLKDIVFSGPVSGIGFKTIEMAHGITDYKEYLVKQVSLVETCWTWLRNNPLHSNFATCHPKKEGHKLWANYLLTLVRNTGA